MKIKRFENYEKEDIDIIKDLLSEIKDEFHLKYSEESPLPVNHFSVSKLDQEGTFVDKLGISVMIKIGNDNNYFTNSEYNKFDNMTKEFVMRLNNIFSEVNSGKSIDRKTQCLYFTANIQQ